MALKSNFKSDEPCACCGHDVDNEVTYHHEYSQGAYPEYKHEKWNKVPLCSKHHVGGVHQVGTYEMSIKFNTLYNWLTDNGWYVFELGGISSWEHD